MIDTHPGLNEETLLSIAISDTLVVLLRPDKQDFQGTGVTVDVARKLQVPKMLMVANKVLPEFDFDALRQDIETTYDATLAGNYTFIGTNGAACQQRYFLLAVSQSFYKQNGD